MQENQNLTIRPLFHVAEEFISYFVFLLHMIITAYITFLIYLANRHDGLGTICLVAFFIDWNILLFVTMPLLRYVKKGCRKTGWTFAGPTCCYHRWILADQYSR